MASPPTFADVVDAADQLDANAQAELVAVLTRRLAERGRDRMAVSVAGARSEFATGSCRPVAAADLIAEVTS